MLDLAGDLLGELGGLARARRLDHRPAQRVVV
jgi:hypothetical protein